MRTMFTTFNIRGRKIPVSVDDGDGKFYAEIDGDEVTRGTLQSLRATLSSRAAKEAVETPIISVEESWESGKLKIKKGVVTGKHSGNGNLLLRYEGEDTTRQGYRYGCKILRGDTNTGKLRALYAAKEKAKNAYSEFISDHLFTFPDGEKEGKK